MTSEFDHEKCRQHVCHGCFRYFWTVENYDVEVSCPYCGENPHHPDRRGEHNSSGDTLVVEGDYDDPSKPDGDVYELENGHRYEMGVSHDCGVDDCPANVGRRDADPRTAHLGARLKPHRLGVLSPPKHPLVTRHHFADVVERDRDE